MRVASKVYTPEMIIVSAELIGFAKKEATKETCTHHGCGYRKGEVICPKCRSTSHEWKEVITDKERLVLNTQSAYYCTECGTLIYNKIVEEDGKKKLKRIRVNYVGGTGPIKCKHTSKFTMLSESELCNPENKVHHAVLQTKTYVAELRDVRSTLVIIDLDTSTCEPGMWAYNSIAKVILKNGDLDTSKIVNLQQMLDNIF